MTQRDRGTSRQRRESTRPFGREHRRALLATVACVAAITSVAALGGCTRKLPQTPESPTAAVVGERTITLEEVDGAIKQELFDRSFPADDPSRLFDAREAALDQIVDEEVVRQAAAGSGLEPDAWLARETEARYPVGDAEVDAFWKEYAHRLPKDRPEAEIREDIRAYLLEESSKELTYELRQQARIRRVLARPRHDVAPRGEPRGPVEAPITIVEFSDFECPYCLRATPTIQALLERYPKDVRLYYRHLPLPSHPRARPAALASVCAERQGAFWAYHDLLFENQRALGDDDLQRYAAQLELDLERFAACMESAETAARVDEDLAAASALGITGTPVFFINGIKVRGAQPLAKFVRVVDQELAALAEE